MNYKNLFVNLLVTIILGLVGNIGMAQPTPEAFTSWTFDEAVEPQYWYGTSFIAEFGNFSNAVLYADGTHGSSQFATVTTTNYAQMLKNDWTGTVLGDTREEPFDGYCLGIKHPNSAGRRIVLSTPTTLYSKISLRYAVTRSNTGFKKMIFEWSTDGSTYHLIQEKPCEPLDFEVQYLNMEDLTVLEDQPMIYLRITVDSILSTAYQGNIKFDNLTFMGCMATASTCTSGACALLTSATRFTSCCCMWMTPPPSSPTTPTIRKTRRLTQQAFTVSPFPLPPSSPTPSTTS